MTFVREATGLTREISGGSALIGNLLSMGVAGSFFYAFFSELLFPGANLPVTVVFSIVPSLIVGYVYYLLTVSMPRTGGDYVWISRILSPTTGFTTNWVITNASMQAFATAIGLSCVTYGLSPMFVALGILQGNASLTSLGTYLSTPVPTFVLIVAFQLVAVIPNFIGTKFTFKFSWVLFVISGAGAFVTLFAFLFTPPSVFVSNFNALSGMNYADVITKANMPAGISLPNTLNATIFTMLSYVGFTFSAYYAGEVKRAGRSQFLAIVGSVLLFSVFIGGVYLAAGYSIGSDFLIAIANLAGTGSSSYTLPVAPSLNFLLLFATPNAAILIISSLGLVAMGVGTVTIYYFITVRNFFAWSFDRVMPSWFAKLDSRGTPAVAIAVMWLIAVFYAALYAFTVFTQFLLYMTVLYTLGMAIACLAGAILPYRRKALFESSPDIVKRKVAGVPLITIFGVLGLILMGYLSYAAVSPAVTPPPSGPPVVQAVIYLAVPLTILAGIIIYQAAYYIRKKQGLDMNLVFTSIPPE
ncbi:MAG TPA: amino acid permease [Candidatus Acidoferrales bacterium]|nr:amino acid permease [Candidatus Acidoferrales bacterium]